MPHCFKVGIVFLCNFCYKDGDVFYCHFVLKMTMLVMPLCFRDVADENGLGLGEVHLKGPRHCRQIRKGMYNCTDYEKRRGEKNMEKVR